jgi:double-stranded uracil-DNA glycosylase
MPKPAKGPSREAILAAHGQTMPDIIAKDLKVLFCGINPSLYSVVIGHHFGRPGNRFWPALHQAGFTPRLYNAREDASLLELGYGITNMVSRATARADELTKDEIVAGRAELSDKIRHYQPECVAFLGISAYRIAFAQPKAKIGPQLPWPNELPEKLPEKSSEESLKGSPEKSTSASQVTQPDVTGQTAIWALPNPSGLNAHYQVKDLAEVYRWLLDSLP